MNNFTLHCLGDHGKKGAWDFRPVADGMRVAGPHGELVCEFPHREAQDRFWLPRFGRTSQNLGFQPPHGRIVWFRPDRKSVAAVEEYLDASLAFQGEEAVQRVAKRGGLQILAGLGLVVLGVLGVASVACFVQGDLRAARLLPFSLPGILVLTGIGAAAQGTRALLRARRARRRVGPCGAP